MARILAIDYGRKRTGLAVTDPLQIIAGGLATVSTSGLFDWLQQYLQQEQVERIVIGEPRQPNGQPSENLQRVQQFVNRWRKAHPEIPIDYYDERFTSVLAHQAMLSHGISMTNVSLVSNVKVCSSVVKSMPSLTRGSQPPCGFRKKPQLTFFVAFAVISTTK